MTSVGTIISASDYNAIQSRVNTVMGSGSGNSGYGQTLSSSAVVPGLNITATQWAYLKQDILKAAVHQGTSQTDDLKKLVGARFQGSITGNVLTVDTFYSGSGNLLTGLELYGDNVTNETTIVSQLTGTTGALGTYQISNSMNIGNSTFFVGGEIGRAHV